MSGRTRRTTVPEIKIVGADGFVELTRGYIAVIDAADATLVSGIFWHAHISKDTVYAAGPASELLMHRVITDAPDGVVADHRDGDGLNNRRANLRVCSHSQNLANWLKKNPTATSSFKGVCWDSSRGRWMAYFKANGVFKNLGRFDSEENAARAHDAAMRVAFPGFSTVNFPEGDHERRAF